MVLAEHPQHSQRVRQEVRPRLKEDVDNWIGKTATFVLANLPEYSFLKRWINTGGDPKSFLIGSQKWSLETHPDTICDQPARFITLTRDNPNKDLLIEGICIDESMENIIGVYRRVGQHQIGITLKPINLMEAIKEARENKENSARRSLARTKSVPRTSELLRLRREFVRASLRRPRKRKVELTL